MTQHTFLILENASQDFSFFSTWFKDEPYDFYFPENESEALHCIREKSVHIVLADMQLRDSEGLSLLRQVARQRPEIIRLAMSERPDTGSLIAAINDGNVHGYLNKPLQFHETERVFGQAVMLWDRQRQQKDHLAELKGKNQDLETRIHARDRQLLTMESKAYIGNHAVQMVHNLNSSLNNIMNSMEIIESILSEDHPDLAEVFEYCSDAKCSAVDLQKIIFEILVHRGDQREIRSEAVDMNRIIQSECKFFEIDPVFKYDIDTHIELEENLPTVWANPIHMKQIIENLIKNSIDAMEHSPVKRIKVETHIVEDRVVMKIADTGEGIPDENLPKIFFPDFTTKPLGKGTGLGLASVKSMVESNHGEITVVSSKGNGTVITITLPVDRREVARNHHG